MLDAGQVRHSEADALYVPEGHARHRFTSRRPPWPSRSTTTVLPGQLHSLVMTVPVPMTVLVVVETPVAAVKPAGSDAHVSLEVHARHVERSAVGAAPSGQSTQAVPSTSRILPSAHTQLVPAASGSWPVGHERHASDETSKYKPAAHEPALVGKEIGP